MANSIKFMNEGFEAKYGNIKPDLCEQIYTVLKRLTEANMSPEDEADTKLLYSIYDKKLQRSNAALTPEEKAVLNKYNLGDVYSYKNSWGNKRAATGYTQGSDVYEPIKRGQHVRSTETNRNVNLADRARKMGMRAYNKGAVGEYDRDFQNNYRAMKDDIWDRKYYQKKLDSIDKAYDEKEAKLLKQLDILKKDREQSREYHQMSLDASNSRINKRLKRESLLSEDVSDLKKFVINYCRDQWEDAYIDNVCDAVSRIDDINDTDDLSDAIDSSLIYDYDRWVVIEHFADPDDFNTSQYISELADNIYNIYQIQKDTGLSTSRIANSELPNGFGRDRLINFVNQVMERIDDLEEGDELYQIEEEISNNIVNDNDLWTIIEYYADESDRENTLFQNAYNKYENDVYYVALKYYNE